jgi:flavin-dependent dehydrogenase
VPLPRGLVLSREVLDARLVEEAVIAGVEFRQGTPINKVADARSFARVVIVASGLAGGDAMPVRGSRIGGGVVLSADTAPDSYKPHAIHMATGRGGYVGLVRVEDERLDVAAAFDPAFVKSAGGLGAAAELILLQVNWPVPRGLSEAYWKGTPTLTRRSVRFAEHGVFVVGDAAGYIEPFTGEGIAWALMSAAALTPIAARAVRKWDDSLARDWEAVHCLIVRRRQRVCRVVSRVLRSPLLTRVAVGALRYFPVLSRPVVAALNRPARLGLRR